MKRNLKPRLLEKILTLIFLLLFIFSGYSQVSTDRVLNSYNSHTLATREVVYLHLNKSTFIKNEMIGFSAYVFDKNKKILSSKTKNLYCTISDKDNNIVKSKLVKVQNGLSNNVFQVDSLFTSGIYTFRAYTNWMLNFNERNYYEHPFLVINPDTQKEVKKTIVKKKYSIQLLPEGGHLVSESKNNLGIIIKDEKGFGLSNAKGKIIDNKNETITEFTLNKFGITKVKLTPKASKQYKVIVSHNNKNITSNITKIDSKGVNLSLVRFENEIAISLKTNPTTAQLLNGKKYKLFIHNGKKIKVKTLYFKRGGSTLFIKHADLFTGVNIFTVFDLEKSKPILERLFFNYNGIKKNNIKNIITKVESDSISVELALQKSIDKSKIQNISISILPIENKSYHFNSTILSKTNLESYVRGFIEDAGYYFSNVNEKVKEDLDNLLITQGWSSYDWNDIFKNTPYRYTFENGINITAKINGDKGKGFIIHSSNKADSTLLITPKKYENEFKHLNLYPIESQEYKVSLLWKNNRRIKPNLYLNFYPSKVPQFESKLDDTPHKNNLLVETFDSEEFKIKKSSSTSISQIQLLDEVVVKSEDKEATKIERLKNSKPFSKIEFLDDRITRNKSLAAYISSKGLEARVLPDGRIFINDPRPLNASRFNTPVVMVDGVKLLQTSCGSTPCYSAFLASIRLEIIEYIEINRSGVGVGNGRSLINIKTNPAKRQFQRNAEQDYQGISKYKFPLTFDSPNKYYVPIYKNYSSKFFKEYGTIQWFPDLKVDKNGKISFKILNTFSENVNLYIEGIVNDGTFISDVKKVSF